MTKTNAQTKTAAKVAKAAKLPDDTIKSSRAASGSDQHIVTTGDGRSLVFPTELWTGDIRRLAAPGQSFAVLKIAVEAAMDVRKLGKPLAGMARGVTSRDAPQSAKAISDARGKATASTKTDKAMVTAKAKTEKRAAAKVAGTADDTRKIVAVVPNPKRPGTDSFARFAAYKKGMTVAQALAAGVTRADIAWDTQRNFITLS